MWVCDEIHRGVEAGKVGGRAPGDAARAEPPRPLFRDIPPPAPYPIEALGPILAPVARRATQVIKVPDALAAQSALGAASYVVQGLRDVVIDGRVYPLSLFLLLLGLSGERKSATDDAMLAPHMKYQAGLQKAYETELAHYINEEDIYKRARQEILADKGEPLGARGVRLAALGVAPEPPLIPTLFAAEPTIEGLFKMMARGRPSIGLFSDEAGQFLGGHAMSADAWLRTVAGLSKCWDGRPISRVRGGDGIVELRGRRLTLHLLAQPGVAQSMLGHAGILDQGLLSRCLVAWPTTLIGTREYAAVNFRGDGATRAYDQRMDELLRTKQPLVEGTRNELNLPALVLRQEAKAAWVSFHNDVEHQLGEGGALSQVRGFGAKAAEHVLRVAGVLAVVETPEATEISASTLDAAVCLVRFYLGEAKRLFETTSVDPDLDLAERLLQWLHSLDSEYIDTARIYQRGPKPIRDAKTAKRISSILAEHGWLTRVDGGMEIDDQFRREVWRITPLEAGS